MKAFILSCFSRLRRLSALIVLPIGFLTLPAVAHRLAAQTVTWTSSDTAVATVDATGTVTAVSDGTVTITAAITQNGKTITSSKTVETVLDDCSACFYFQSSIDTQARTYCGVKLANGQCWMDRNIGASRVATGYNYTSAYGIMRQNNAALPSNICPNSWKIPAEAEILSGWSSALGVNLQIGVSRRANYYLTLASGPLKIPASCNTCSSGASNSTFWTKSNPGYFGWEGSSELRSGSNSTPLGVRCLRSY